MDKLFRTRVGVILLSIIWGLAIPVLFKKVCKDCIVVQGPDPKESTRQVYENKGKCYVFKPYVVNCSDNIKTNYEKISDQMN